MLQGLGLREDPPNKGYCTLKVWKGRLHAFMLPYILHVRLFFASSSNVQ